MIPLLQQPILHAKQYFMARQKGVIKLQGTIGDITFYKSKDGHLAREKGGVAADRIATDPNFQRTRENGSEFGRAGTAGKILRNAIRSVLQNAKDGRMVSRLTTEMIKVIRADVTSMRGQRNVIDGEAELLEGFDFNINAKLSSTHFAPYTSVINRATGEVTVAIPSFVPVNMIVAPNGTTHYKLLSAAAEVDFTNGVFVTDVKETIQLPWDNKDTKEVVHANKVTANSTHPLFLLLGIQFFQEVNGTLYSLRNGAYNALAIVKVSGV